MHLHLVKCDTTVFGCSLSRESVDQPDQEPQAGEELVKEHDRFSHLDNHNNKLKAPL